MTTAQISKTTKTDRPMSDFAITQTDATFTVTLDGEWMGTFGSSYGANLHIACIAA